MYLMIAEVSQKQAYIFSSLKLRDNIKNSADIDTVLSEEYLNGIEGCNCENTVLQFESEGQAVEFAKRLTLQVRRDFNGMELFVKVMKYDENKTPAENIDQLCIQLEEKKSIRRSAFQRYSFGVDCMIKESEDVYTKEKRVATQGEKYPDYYLAEDLNDLGCSGGEKSFVAVVHIDGNSMGNRVRNLKEKYGSQCGREGWERFKKKYRQFCDSTDRDYKAVFDEMVHIIIQNIESGNFSDLNLKQKNGKKILPIRKIILAGDDVCFACDGRIGLECANIFLKRLMSIKNPLDDEPYYAAAGVCIVHSKFPFYRAYNVAEGMCRSAKHFIAENAESPEGEGRAAAIDWHIDFGEMEGSVSELKKNYIAKDNTNLLLRPYYVGGGKIICYDSFKKILTSLQKERAYIPRSKMKRLREALKKGKTASEYFIRFNKIEDILYNPINDIVTVDNSQAKGLNDLKIEKGIYYGDKCVVFDAIESVDMFVSIKEAQE